MLIVWVCTCNLNNGNYTPEIAICNYILHELRPRFPVACVSFAHCLHVICVWFAHAQGMSLNVHVCLSSCSQSACSSTKPSKLPAEFAVPVAGKEFTVDPEYTPLPISLLSRSVSLLAKNHQY